MPVKRGPPCASARAPVARGMATFLYLVVGALLQLVVFILFANAILSWLVMFDIVNLRNRFAYSVAQFLDRVTRPILWPFQRIIPPLGGVDITPVIAIIIIWAAQAALVPKILLLAPYIG